MNKWGRSGLFALLARYHTQTCEPHTHVHKSLRRCFSQRAREGRSLRRVCRVVHSETSSHSSRSPRPPSPRPPSPRLPLPLLSFRSLPPPLPPHNHSPRPVPPPNFLPPNLSHHPPNLSHMPSPQSSYTHVPTLLTAWLYTVLHLIR